MLTTKQLDYINQCRAAFLQQLAVVLGQRITEQPYNMLSSEMAKKYDVVSGITRLHLLEIPVSPQELAALELEICHAATQFAVVCKSVIEQCDELGVQQLAHAAVSNLFEFMRRDTSSELSWDAANLFKAISEGSGALWPLSDAEPLSVMRPYQHLLHYSSPSTVYHDHPAVYVEPQVPRMSSQRSSLSTVNLDLNRTTDSRLYEALRGFQQDFSRFYQVLPPSEKTLFQSRVLQLPELQQRLYDRYRCRKAALPMIEPEVMVIGKRQPLYEYLARLQDGYKKLTIIGSSLSGKSTLSHYVEETAWRARFSPIGQLPFVIDGKKLAELKKNADLVEAYLKKYYELNSHAINQLLQQKRQDASAGILFIIDVACAEEKLLERLLIDSQHWIHAQCLWILPEGLCMINLQKSSPMKAQLMPFSPEQITQYWYTRGVPLPDIKNAQSMALTIDGDEPDERGSMAPLAESGSPLTQMMLVNYAAGHNSQNIDTVTQYELYEDELKEHKLSPETLFSISIIAIDCFSGKKTRFHAPIAPLPDFLTQSTQDDGYYYEFNTPHWYEFFVAQQFIAEYRQTDLRPGHSLWNTCFLRGEHEGIGRFIAQYFYKSPVEAIDFLYKRFSMLGYAEEWNNATMNANRIVGSYLRHHREVTVDDLRRCENPHFVATRISWEMRLVEAVPLTITQRSYIYGELGHGAGISGGTTQYDNASKLSSVRYQHINQVDITIADNLFKRAVEFIRLGSDEQFYHLIPSTLGGYNSKTRLQELAAYADNHCLSEGKLAFLRQAIAAFKDAQALAFQQMPLDGPKITQPRMDVIRALEAGLEDFIKAQYDFFKTHIVKDHSLWIDPSSGKRRDCHEPEVIESRWKTYQESLRDYAEKLLKRLSEENISKVEELEQEQVHVQKEHNASQSNREFLGVSIENLQYATRGRFLLLLELYDLKEKFLAEPERGAFLLALAERDDFSQVTQLLQRLLSSALNEHILLSLPQCIHLEKRRVLAQAIDAFIANNHFLKGLVRQESRALILDALENGRPIEGYFNLEDYHRSFWPQNFHLDLAKEYYNTLSQYLSTREDTQAAWASFSDKKKQRLIRVMELTAKSGIQRDDLDEKLETLMESLPEDLLSSIEIHLNDSRESFFKNWLTEDYPGFFESLERSEQEQLLTALAKNDWNGVEAYIKSVLPKLMAAEFYYALPDTIRAGVAAGIEAHINTSLAFSELNSAEFSRLLSLIRTHHHSLNPALVAKMNQLLDDDGSFIETERKTYRFLVTSVNNNDIQALKQFLENTSDEGREISQKLVLTDNTRMLLLWQSKTFDSDKLIDALLKEDYSAFFQQFYDFMKKPSADFLERYLRFGLSPDACHSQTHETLLVRAVKQIINYNNNIEKTEKIVKTIQHLLHCGATVGVHYTTLSGIEESLLDYVDTHRDNLQEISKQLSYIYTVFEHADEYSLELMSLLPSGNKKNAEEGKIYVSHDGKYIVRDFNGDIHHGTFNPNRIFGNRFEYNADSLKKAEVEKAILAIASKAGHTPRGESNEQAIFDFIYNAVMHLIEYQNERDLISIERDGSWILRLLATIRQSGSIASDRKDSVTFYEACIQKLMKNRLSPEVTLKDMEDHSKTVVRRFFGHGKSDLNDPIGKMASSVLAGFARSLRKNSGALITVEERQSLAIPYHQRVTELSLHSREDAHRRAELLERERNEIAVPPKEECESDEVRKLKKKLDLTLKRAEVAEGKLEQIGVKLKQEIPEFQSPRVSNDSTESIITEQDLMIAAMVTERMQASQEKIAADLSDELVSNEFKGSPFGLETGDISRERFGQNRHTLYGRTSSPELQVDSHCVVVEVKDGNNNGNVVSSETDETTSHTLH